MLHIWCSLNEGPGEGDSLKSVTNQKTVIKSRSTCASETRPTNRKKELLCTVDDDDDDDGYHKVTIKTLPYNHKNETTTVQRIP